VLTNERPRHSLISCGDWQKKEKDGKGLRHYLKRAFNAMAKLEVYVLQCEF
jgi:hypothetical protein